MCLQDRIAVKGITTSFEEAVAEVERLNLLNGNKGCIYFWTPTRGIGAFKKDEKQ